jgi:hypothetical protein
LLNCSCNDHCSQLFFTMNVHTQSDWIGLSACTHREAIFVFSVYILFFRPNSNSLIVLRKIEHLRSAGHQIIYWPKGMESARLSSSLPSNLSLLEEAMKKKRKNPFIIGVCGGTASGKTSVCEDIPNNSALSEKGKNKKSVLAERHLEER